MSEQEPATWLNQRERGALVLIRCTFYLATLLGRRVMRPLVCGLALWYRCFDRSSTRASREWLARVLGRPPSFRETYRHFRNFVQVTLDRVFLLSGRTQGLVLTRTGSELLHQQRATGRGAVLLGAHLGSFEAMRATGAAVAVPIRIVGYFENARMINSLLERLAPDLSARVIHVGRDPVALTMQVQAAIARGEFVALLGDRVGLGDRAVSVPFFGSEARFAAGPFLLAALLRCPIYLVFGLYREPNEYHLHCEHFADRLDLPRGDRPAALTREVTRYAARLEQRCREAPDNWFNFFDFWKGG